MKRSFLIGTLYGGLIEHPDYKFIRPYMIIETDTPAKAVNIYNGKTHATFFYGSIIAEIVDCNLKDISKYITKEEAEQIYLKIK